MKKLLPLLPVFLLSVYSPRPASAQEPAPCPPGNTLLLELENFGGFVFGTYTDVMRVYNNGGYFYAYRFQSSSQPGDPTSISYYFKKLQPAQVAQLLTAAVAVPDWPPQVYGVIGLCDAPNQSISFDDHTSIYVTGVCSTTTTLPQIDCHLTHLKNQLNALASDLHNDPDFEWHYP